MKLKFLPMLLAFFTLMTLASATPVLNASESAFTVEHGNSKTITLTLSNTDPTFALTNIVFNVSSSIGTFSFSPSTISSISSNSTSQTSLTLTIPQNQAQTTFSAVVNASGLLNSTSTSNTTSLTITIPENRSLAITNIGSLTTGTNTTTFRVKNTGNVQLSGSVSVSSINDGKGGQLNLTISPTTSFTLNPNNDTTFNVSVASGRINVFGTHSGTITATSGTANVTGAISFQETFCDSGQKGGDLRITRLKDNTLDNKDEFKWRPSNDIELEVKVENIREDDIDAVLEYELYDPIDNTFVDLDQDEIDVSIDEKSSETVTINFRIPEDLDIDGAASRDFQLFIKVAEEGSESKQCTDSSDKFSNTAFQSVTIKKESHEVILDDLDVPTSALCGEIVELTAKLVNIGRNDEDRVRVTLVNKELGISLEKTFDSLDESDTRTISFSVPVSRNAAEKTHTLDLATYYNYDKGVFKDESADNFKAFLKVQGNCQVSAGNAAITASLISDAKAGGEAVIKTTLKNLGSSQTAFTLFVSGYETFAESADITPSTMTLAPSETREATINLNLKDTASGDNTFSIKAVSDGKATEQTVVLTISSAGFDFGNLNLGNLSGNWFIWLVIIINVILIILIIVIATRRRE